MSLDIAHRHRCLEEDPAFIALHTPDVLSALLPDATALHLEACEVDAPTTQITLRVRAAQTSAPCPLLSPVKK